MIGPARIGPDPVRDNLVDRISAIADRHHYGREVTREDVAFLLGTIAKLPHGVAVVFAAPQTWDAAND